MTNSDDGSPGFFAGKILAQFTPIVKKAVAPETQVSAFDPSWEKYVGMYTDPSWFDTEIMIYNNQLVMNSYSFPPEDNPSSEIMILKPEGKNTFRMAGENGNGELLIFELNENDEVIRVKVGENYIIPKSSNKIK